MAAKPTFVPASEESKGIASWRLGDLRTYAKAFGGSVQHFSDCDDDAGWSFEGFTFNHPALKDADAEVIYASEWDCLCALLEAITKNLISEGFGPESVSK